MSKRYRKMAKKANGKIREIKEGQVILEMPLPIADVLAGIPDAVEGVHGEGAFGIRTLCNIYRWHRVQGADACCCSGIG
jgi:hypothetical protein